MAFHPSQHISEIWPKSINPQVTEFEMCCSCCVVPVLFLGFYHFMSCGSTGNTSVCTSLCQPQTAKHSDICHWELLQEKEWCPCPEGLIPMDLYKPLGTFECTIATSQVCCMDLVFATETNVFAHLIFLFFFRLDRNLYVKD